MNRISKCIPAVLALVACSSTPEPPETGPLEVGDPIRVVREAGVAFQDDGEEFLFHPSDLALAGDSLIVVDNGNDRIVILDTALAVLATIGREGEGPGEFASPISVRVTPSEIFVAEINNGRFTVLDRRGQFVRTFGDMVPSTAFAIDSRGAIYHATRSLTHHAIKVSADGEHLFAPRRDTAVGEEAMAIMKTTRESWLAVTAGDTVHVFNDTDGTISKYSPDGERITTRPLPGFYIDSLKARRLRLVKALSRYGVTEFSGTLIGGFTTTPDNQILVVGSAGTTIGLLIDPIRYVARPIVVDRMTGEWEPLRVAQGVAILGNRLYAAAMDQLYAYELDFGETR